MTGLLVGAVFGAVFVLVNAGGPLGGAVAGVLRVAACLGAAGVVAMWFMTVRGERRSGQPQGPGMYGRGYLLIVLAEVVLLFGGLRVLAALGAPEQANVAWVAFVVGGCTSSRSRRCGRTGRSPCRARCWLCSAWPGSHWPARPRWPGCRS
ncbi:hypothetical protein [Nonomuraea salmonea]|uniref:hypothetical protein n=1 Tax=Nonomuraea salmonea TaxID=46181 RepID=UPI0031E611F1